MDDSEVLSSLIAILISWLMKAGVLMWVWNTLLDNIIQTNITYLQSLMIVLSILFILDTD